MRMFHLLLAITALPVFLSEIYGEGEILTIGTIQNSGGYCTVSNVRDYPGAWRPPGMSDPLGELIRETAVEACSLYTQPMEGGS